MAKTTTVQKIRDKWAILCGLDKDNIIGTQKLIQSVIKKLNIPAIIVTHSLEYLHDIQSKEIIKI